MSDYLNNAKASIGNATESITQNIPDSNAVANNISNTANTFRETTQTVTSDFSSKGVMDASQDFLNSNSMIARFVFLILVLIVFLALLNVGIALVAYFIAPNKNPYIIHGMASGTEYLSITQDPASGNPVIYRSNNQTGGIEFTWATWIRIDTMPIGNDEKKHVIFVKGTDEYNDTDGLAKVNNGPGLYIVKDVTSATENSNKMNLHFVMDVVSTDAAGQINPINAIIPNIPIKKWFHVAIRLQNKTMDCYVNGVITTRVSFGDYIPKQNYDSIIYAGNGGFPGAVSNLRYYDYALSVFEINSIVYYGPNLSSANGSAGSFFDYLGQNWYSAK